MYSLTIFTIYQLQKIGSARVGPRPFISSLAKASVESFRPVHRSRRLPDVPRVVSTAPALVSNATITVCSDSSIDSDVVLLSSCSRCMARGALVHLLGGVLVNDVLCFASTGERVR